jgi:glycine cleavage system H protein
MSDDFFQEVADKFIFTVKKSFLYTENDVWIEMRNGKAKIGITDFLQRQGGDAVFVELPQKGKIVRRGDEISSFETIKAVVSITSPFECTVTEVNSTLNDKPELINEDPYGEGWLVLVSPSHLEEDKQYLMTAEKYFELMKSKIKDELGKGSRKEV